MFDFINDLILKGFDENVSDVHLTVAMPPVYRINGELIKQGETKLTPEDIEKFVKSIISPNHMETLQEKGEVDFSYSIPQKGRLRVNVYHQRTSLAVAMRILQNNIPEIAKLGLSETVRDLCYKPRGIILVTGPTGSGKSTTLAAMIGEMNKNRNCHIVTIEDPIEYLHRHGSCMINQREVGDDTQTFSNALRAALREDPDIIMVGEMRDLETIGTAITASETGHLVLSTLHTTSAAQTIDRIVDVFPPSQQQQVKVQLASVLVAVISQQLIRTADGRGRAIATEVLLTNDAVRNLIREGKTHMINSVIQTNIGIGMMPMDYSLAELVKAKKITMEEGTSHCGDLDLFKRYVSGGLY
jgi:twitching motility protein PilT